MQRIIKIWDLVERNILGNVASICFASGLAICIVEVFSRYLFRSSKAWSNELATLLFVAGVVLYFGIALRDECHIRVSLFADRMPKLAKEILETITNIIAIIFCLMLIRGGLKLILEVKRLGYATEVLRIPTFLPYSLLTLGILLLAIGYFINIGDRIRALFSVKAKS